MLIYKHYEEEYQSINELRKAFPNISIPDDPTSDVLADINIELADIEAPKTLAEIKVAYKQRIASARWQAETSGLEFNGFIIATDRESQSLINSAVTSTLLDPTYTVKWKMANGFVGLDAQMIQAVGMAVRDHVQSCFNKEAELYIAIDDAESAEGLAAVVWPEL